MQANEKWVDRPEVELGELSLLLQGYLNSSVPIISDICKRRKYLLQPINIFGLVLAEPAYQPEYFNAAMIVMDAIRENKFIVIAGDYDVDGMTATAVLAACLKYVDARYTWWIPERSEGYGVKADKIFEVLSKHNEANALVITVDNGISAKEEIAKLTENGCSVIVTDHHLAEGKELPSCSCILNPKIFAKEGSDEYMASGCYIAAKLGLEITKMRCRRESYTELENYCEALVGLSILSDMIPLNRTMRNMLALATTALPLLQHSGIKALLFLCGYREGVDITTNFLSYMVIPKLNAAGRMNCVNAGMQVLLDMFTDEKEAVIHANALFNLNRDRKLIEDSMIKEAFLSIERIYRVDDDHAPTAIIVHKEDWHVGILGIVAARLVDIFKVPVICLAGKDELHGSGRAPNGYDLYAGLESCKDILTEFGGHRTACGVALSSEKLSEFRVKFSDYYRTDGDHSYELYLDSTGTIDQLKNVRFQLFLKTAEPFGSENEPLNILLKNVTVLNVIKRVDSVNIIIADSSGNNLLLNKFRPDETWTDMLLGEKIDVVVSPNLTYFTGMTTPEYRAVSFRYVKPEATPLPKGIKVFTNEEEFNKHLKGE